MLVRMNNSAISGGESPKLLWEGDGTLPTTITLSEAAENFTHLIFYFYGGEGGSGCNTYGICEVGKVPLYSGSFNNGQNLIAARGYSVSGTTLTFEQTSHEYSMSGGHWQNNTYAIPLKIYGLNID